MNYSQTLLTSLKANNDGISDYRAAKILGCTRSHISGIKSGRVNMSENMAIRIAKMSGMSPEKVVIKLLIDKSESDEMRQVWEEIQEKISH